MLTRPGGAIVRGDELVKSIRDDLVALLPRMRRFAFALCGNAQARDVLLRLACVAMMDNAYRYQRGTPFDRWAYGEIYRAWLALLRSQDDPFGQARAQGGAFAARLYRDDGAFDAAARFIDSLSPPQRASLALIHGEHFTYEDAATVLDTTEDAIRARIKHAQTGLADRLSGRFKARTAPVEILFPPEPNGPRP